MNDMLFAVYQGSETVVFCRKKLTATFPTRYFQKASFSSPVQEVKVVQDILKYIIKPSSRVGLSQ